MKYDKYGKRYSIVLDEILENYIKAEKKAGREVTQFEINSFDTALCNTIDNIRSVSEDEQVIEESMNNLQQLMKSGNMNIADMPKIATSVTEEVAKEVETKRQISDTVSNIIDTTASILVNGVVIPAAVSTVSIYTVNKALIDSMCTPKMESLHKETFEKAKNGDEKALVELDAIKRASSYQLSKDGLNPKGKEAGALALIMQLATQNSPESLEVAIGMINRFELGSSLIKGEKIDIDGVRNRLQELKPGINVDKILQKSIESAIKRRDKILSTSTESYRQDVENLAERKRIFSFIKEYGKTVDSNNQEAAELLVGANLELAQKALYVQKRLCDNSHRNGKENISLDAKTNRLAEMVNSIQALQHINKKDNRLER